jgi:hypothetical protein
MSHKTIFFWIIIVVACSSSRGQSVVRTYPRTIRTVDDTIRIKFSNSSSIIPLIIEGDSIDMGTDGTKGMHATIYFGIDSLSIPYVNLPYTEIFFFRLQSRSRTTIFKLHFNKVRANFSSSYISANQGKVLFEIPEVYELANIIWTLSPSGQRATNLYKEGRYYKKVLSYFKPFLEHPIFKALDFPDSLYFRKYYDFRENSLAYTFVEDKLTYQGPYYYVMGDNWKTYNSQFRELLPLIEDFVKKSKYRKFFKDNSQDYKQQIQRERELMPIRNMWDWLEKEFPLIKVRFFTSHWGIT